MADLVCVVCELVHGTWSAGVRMSVFVARRESAWGSVCCTVDRGSKDCRREHEINGGGKSKPALGAHSTIGAVTYRLRIFTF
jgi:hypothetical protein